MLLGVPKAVITVLLHAFEILILFVCS
jgi:hypothetical protein